MAEMPSINLTAILLPRSPEHPDQLPGELNATGQSERVNLPFAFRQPKPSSS